MSQNRRELKSLSANLILNAWHAIYCRCHEWMPCNVVPGVMMRELEPRSRPANENLMSAPEMTLNEWRRVERSGQAWTSIRESRVCRKVDHGVDFHIRLQIMFWLARELCPQSFATRWRVFCWDSRRKCDSNPDLSLSYAMVKFRNRKKIKK